MERTHTVWKIGVVWDDLPPEILTEFSVEAQELLERLATELVELEEGSSEELISSIFRSFHTLKGSAGFLGFTEVSARAHEGESLLDQVRSGGLSVSSDLVSTLLRCVDDLDREVALAVAATGKYLQRDLLAGSSPLGQEVLPPDQSTALAATTAAAQESLASLGDAPLTHPAPYAEPSTVRVRLDSLDGLMAASGELVVARNRLHTDLVRRSATVPPSLQDLDRAVRDVQAQAARARLQPLSVLLSKLPRLVRDTALELGKTVRVELHGAATEVDRSLIDAIRDPLVHLVRNAVDHGLESPDTRVSLGKSPLGTISVTAWQAAGSAHVAISDDGAGINWDAVRVRALQMGLLDPASPTSEETLSSVLMAPGFSTASRVSTVSGRGVGLDVVHQALEAVGGSVTVQSALGSGTTVTLSMPLSLLVVQALLLRQDGQSFAMDQVMVEEVVSFRRDDVVHSAGAPSITVRGEPVFIVSLPGRRVTREPMGGSYELAVVVTTASGPRGVIVDDVLGIEELAVRPLDPMMRASGIYSGAALLEDGTVALVLSPDAFGTVEHPPAGHVDRSSPATVPQDTEEAFLSALVGGERVVFAARDIVRIESLPVEGLGSSRAGSARYGEGVIPVVGLGRPLSSSPYHDTVVMALSEQGGLVGIVPDELCEVLVGTYAQDLSGSLLPRQVLPSAPGSLPLRLVSAGDVREVLGG